VTVTSNDSLATVPSSVLVPAGSSSVGFAIKTGEANYDRSALITAKVGTSSSAVYLTIRGVFINGLTFSPSSVTGGNTAVGTVSINGPAPWNVAGGAVIALSSNSAYASVPSQVIIPTGKTSVSFTVNSQIVTSSVMATLTTRYLGSSRSVGLTIQPAMISYMSIAPAIVKGGMNMTVSIVLTGKAPAGGALIALSSSNIAYGRVPASVTVPAGATSATVTVTTSPTTLSNKQFAIYGTYRAVTKNAVGTITP
jgi:hypothetical protein